LEKVAASFALPCEYMSLCIQAEVQDEVQAEISENWPIQADAGPFDQAGSKYLKIGLFSTWRT